jgi:uncharacterized membrane protein
MPLPDIPLWAQIVEIVISLSIIVGAVLFTKTLLANNDLKVVLVNIFIMLFVVLVAIYVIDKVVILRHDILTQDESKGIFELIVVTVSSLLALVVLSKKDEK